MKRSLVSLLAAVLLTACGNTDSNDNGATTTVDTGKDGHSAHAHAGNTGTVHNGVDSSMMGLMHANMQQMMSAPSLGSADRDFARLMRIHHQGAVDMAQVELRQGGNEDMKRLAQTIISDQQREQKIFDAFLARQPGAGTDTAFHARALREMQGMHMDMNSGGSVDQQFARMMIPHHQHGISMARAYLDSGARDAELKKLAQSIIASQQREIGTMQEWLNRNP